MKKRQQTNTSRRQKLELFYPKFTSKFNEISLNFLKEQEVAIKWLKLKQSRKPHICDIRGLRVNKQVENPRAALKESPFVIFGFFLPF